MLEEHWSRHPDLHHIKVYQASGVARKALSVFQTYVGMMNSAIQEAVQVCGCLWGRGGGGRRAVCVCVEGGGGREGQRGTGCAGVLRVWGFVSNMHRGPIVRQTPIVSSPCLTNCPLCAFSSASPPLSRSTVPQPLPVQARVSAQCRQRVSGQ